MCLACVNLSTKPLEKNILFDSLNDLLFKMYVFIKDHFVDQKNSVQDSF